MRACACSTEQREKKDHLPGAARPRPRPRPRSRSDALALCRAVGSASMNIPPLDPAGAKGEHFHSLVDNAARPRVFVIQDNTRAFPGTLNPKGVSYHTTSLVRRIIIMRSASSRSVPRVARALSPVAQGISSPTRTPAPGRSRAPRRRPRRGPRGAHARRASPRPSRSWRTRPPVMMGPSPAAHRGVARESGSARQTAASMKWWSSPTTTRRRRKNRQNDRLCRSLYSITHLLTHLETF